MSNRAKEEWTNAKYRKEQMTIAKNKKTAKPIKAYNIIRAHFFETVILFQRHIKS